MIRPSRGLTIAVFVVLSLIWGTTWSAIRIGLQGIPPFTGVALRFAIASTLLLSISPLLRVPFLRTPAEPWLWLSNGLLSFCASYGIVYWSEQWVPSGLAAVLFATFPLMTAILAHLLLPGERLTPASAVGVVVGFAGVAVIFSEDFARLGGRPVLVASAVMLGSPLVSALSSVAIKKWGAGVHPVSITAVPQAIAAGIMGGIALATERGSEATYTPTSVAALLYLAVFGSAVTFTLYYWLLAHLPATRTALIAYTTPVVAVGVGALFLDEPITPRVLAGTALVVGGVALAMRPHQ